MLYTAAPLESLLRISRIRSRKKKAPLVWEKTVPLNKVRGTSIVKIFLINFINSFNCVHQYAFFSFSSKELINRSIKIIQRTNRKSFLANCKRWVESLIEHFIFGFKKCQNIDWSFFESRNGPISIR